VSLQQTIVWLLACFGLTFLLCDAAITAVPRTWLVMRFGFFRKLLACYFCTGFWASLALAVGLIREPLWLVLYGFAGASFSYALNVVLVALEEPPDVIDAIGSD
jgi:hypothetical protein